MEQARKTAQEHNKKRLEAEAAQSAARDVKKTVDNDDDDDDLIGPPLPPTMTKGGETSTTMKGDLIGPPTPELVKDEEGNEKNEDSYDELSGSDDEELTLEKRIPNTHEVRNVILGNSQ